MDADQYIVEEALKNCADEPIRIPGVVQTCGALLAISKDSFTIAYASENCATYLGLPVEGLLGQGIDALLNNKDVHMLRNAISTIQSRALRYTAGVVTRGGQDFHLSVSPSVDTWVLEFEPTLAHGAIAKGEFSTFSMLMSRIQTATTELGLMRNLVAMFSVVSDYDRVIAYRFDAEWNGEVVAEHVTKGLEPYLGLRFPQWDIPAQAREMMKISPVRYIATTDQPDVAVRAFRPDAPPLDMAYAQLRGTSPVHLQYLKNMGLGATLTLSVLVDGMLWGIISFHSTVPKIPPMQLRALCAAVATVIDTKMVALRSTERLRLNAEIETLRTDLKGSTLVEDDTNAEVEAIAAFARKHFDIDGVMIGFDDVAARNSLEVSAPALAAIRQRAQAAPDGVWSSKQLSLDLSDEGLDFGEACGALCLDRQDGHWICFLRGAMTTDVAWAGAPDKDLEVTDGVARLHPRASFSIYSKSYSDMANAWQSSDVSLLEGLALSLIAAGQRAAVSAALRRQQRIVVDELNHRVRNILSLVRSISRQALTSDASLKSYSAALEQRLNALAVAHDLGAKSPSGNAVSAHQVMQTEAAPHIAAKADRIMIAGKDYALWPEAAPLFALVIHELITNAVKYGALSVSEGQVLVSLSEAEGDVLIRWVELGGPTVTPPNSRGFGTTLIEKSIPFELNGKAELTFSPTGVIAEFRIPRDKFVSDTGVVARDAGDAAPDRAESGDAHTQAPDGTWVNGTILVLEDVYMIAMDMSETLHQLGCRDVELVATSAEARDRWQKGGIGLCILDINLGRADNSREFAHELLEAGAPFFFVTGYGEKSTLPDTFASVPKLQKPVSRSALRQAIAQVVPAA